jgi:predicted nucleic acid-binding protein
VAEPVTDPAASHRDAAGEHLGPTRGLLDTSVVVDLDLIDPSGLPDESAISAVTLAELAAGPHATKDDAERARRQDRLQWASATWEALPLDADAARAYGRIFAATRSAGRSSRTRLADLLIAATAAAHGLDLYTRDSADFVGLEGVLRIVEI